MKLKALALPLVLLIPAVLLFPIKTTEAEQPEPAPTAELCEIKPENSWNYVKINEDFDILSPSNCTAEQLNLALNTENHAEMRKHTEAFVKAEQEYGVNAFYLMCKLGYESGWAVYESGVNNIAGWTSYDGSYKDFESVEACILHVAKSLSTTYKEAVGTRLKDVCWRYNPMDGYYEYLVNLMEERQQVIMGASQISK